jgi:hypothetical protein
MLHRYELAIPPPPSLLFAMSSPQPPSLRKIAITDATLLKYYYKKILFVLLTVNCPEEKDMVVSFLELAAEDLWSTILNPANNPPINHFRKSIVRNNVHLLYTIQAIKYCYSLARQLITIKIIIDPTHTKSNTARKRSGSQTSRLAS